MIEENTAIQEQLNQAYSLYESGEYEVAFEKYSTLAELGHRDCQALVGQLYLNGEGVEQDYKKAERWLKLAADQQSAIALYSLGYIYMVIKREYKEGLACYEQAAMLNYSPALYRLGCLYERNLNIGIDREKAYGYFKKSASLGHVFGRRDYAIKLLKGYEGFLARAKGLFMYISVFILAIKIEKNDPTNDSLKV